MIKAVAYSLLTGIVAFLVSSAIIPLVKRIALSIRSVDYPGGRRHQTDAIPRMGGAAVITGFFVGSGIGTALGWPIWEGDITFSQLIAIPLAIFIIFLCGIVEDTIGLSPLSRIFMEIIAALTVIRAGWSFSAFNIPFLGTFQLGFLSEILSLVWIVGVTNAVNLLDGLDGLASGVVTIICATMMILSFWTGDFLPAIVMCAAVGACIGFLRKNWAPAQIYLGDSGSLTLGFILALASVRSSLKASTAIAILVPILALGLPVIDTMLVMLYRFSKSKSEGSGKSLPGRLGYIFRSDRSHLHYLMLRLGPERRKIVIAIYGIAALFCGMAIYVAVSSSANLGLFLVLLEILVVLGIRQLGLRADVLKIALEKRKSVKEELGIN